MGSRLKDFKVKRLLGKGAFGDVYKVLRKSDNQYYALKKVNISSMSTREVADALNEIRLLASLRHPNIVAFMEAFLIEASMELCIVMEYAEGGDLSSKVEQFSKAKRYMEEQQIWSYFLQMLDALEYLHSQKVFHRDIKTANCFLTIDGKVKIGDMNVSKLAKHGLVQTQIGTPYYMSPEIWRNRPYNDRSDVWSLGCVVYELASMRPPFRGRDLEDLSRRVQSGYYPALPRLYSKDLSDVVSLMLQQNPRKRPSAKDLLKLPVVKKWRMKLRERLDETIKTQLQHERESARLMDTIQVPRNRRRITHQLPDPCYPDVRPNSPESWPVTADNRHEEIASRRGSNAESFLPDINSSRSSRESPPRKNPPRPPHSSDPPRTRSRLRNREREGSLPPVSSAPDLAPKARPGSSSSRGSKGSRYRNRARGASRDSRDASPNRPSPGRPSPNRGHPSRAPPRYGYGYQPKPMPAYGRDGAAAAPSNMPMGVALGLHRPRPPQPIRGAVERSAAAVGGRHVSGVPGFNPPSHQGQRPAGYHGRRHVTKQMYGGGAPSSGRSAYSNYSAASGFSRPSWWGQGP